MSNFKVIYGKSDDSVLLGKFQYHSMKPYDGQPKPDFSEMRQPINMYMKSVDLAKIDAPIVAISVIPPYGPGGDIKGVAEKPIELRVSMADALYTVVHKTLIVMAKTIMTAFEKGCRQLG